ncbi:peptidase inhibitor family I36 protein [Streptomyces aureocirculatus]|uniref:peptidase inhibitor family I36 protein n=1 Tax=Streptomyces aureocirculatus TaxID=67275 RepID=UPI0004CB84BE|nr:peptidase inhibitor family I36 protein [Streptomyces aureocirculatus]
MRKPLTSLFVVTTSAAALMLTSGAVVHAADPAPEPTATTTTPPEESVEEPTDEPTDETTEEPTDEPSEEPAEEPSEDPTDKPDGPSGNPPAGEPGAEAPAGPVIADYKGRKINLAESWEGATSCTELPGGEVHCYDTDEEALADPKLPAATRQATLRADAAPGAMLRLPSRCVVDYWCLYQKANHKGKILRFSEDGTKKLKSYGMQNKLSSVYYRVMHWSLNYGDAKITDSRTWPTADRVRRLKAGSVTKASSYPNFKRLGYPGGGNWNDKVDYFEVRRA